MPSDSGGRFQPIAVDLLNGRLRRGATLLTLRPKDATVLHCLLDRRGHLVSKETLLAAGWPAVSVTDAVLKACINRLRAALGDDPDSPRFIQTVHRRGYRFIGDLPVVDDLSDAEREQTRPAAPWAHAIVGRGHELLRLEHAFTEAASGKRRLLFMSGEAGLGKTTLLNVFVTSRVPSEAIVGRGQCVEQYGAGEAYMPLLEALRGMCEEPTGAAVIDALASHAPSWLAQMPGLVSPERAEEIQRRSGSVTRDRMLREFATGLEALSREAPVVLALEDLHWSDASTLDALALVARQRQAARLLVLGTYRPEDALPGEHALLSFVRDLKLQRLSVELRLSPLDPQAVGAYLRMRFPEWQVPKTVTSAVHARTEGHPLLLVALVDHWIATGSLIRASGAWAVTSDHEALTAHAPEDFSRMTESRLERLTAVERQTVEAASISGQAFSAASVAAALEGDVVDVDERCAAIASRRLLFRVEGDEAWPDGTTSGRYRFAHALYREFTYGQVPAARRQQMHRRIAVREEAAWGERADAMAARLAMHWDAAHEPQRAVAHRILAARNAARVGGFREAIAQATAGLAALDGHASDTRDQQELSLQLVLGAARAASEGFASAQAERAYARALELMGQTADPQQAVEILAGLYAFHLMRGRVAITGEIADRLFTESQRALRREYVAWAGMARGVQRLQAGVLVEARDEFERVLADYDITHAAAYRTVHAVDPSVSSCGYLSWTLWMLGYPDQALARGQDALAIGDRNGHPVDRAHALVLQGHLYQFFGQAAPAASSADQALALCAEYGIGQYESPARVLREWARVTSTGSSEAVDGLRAAIAGWAATGAQYAQPRHYALLGEALIGAGDWSGAEGAITDGLTSAETSGERFWVSELHRLQAELRMRALGGSSYQKTRTIEAASASVTRAIDMARGQQARWLELRAQTTACRIADVQGDAASARAALAVLCAHLPEGHDTDDWRDAQALLAP